MADMRHFLDIFARPIAAPALLRTTRPKKSGMLSERVEAVSYASLLTESARSDYLLKTYGEKLAAKYDASMDTEPRNVVQAISAEPGEGDAQKLLSYLASFDPTRNHLYTQWLCVRYLKDALRLEDGERAHEYLSVFEQSKRRIANKDINAYPTMDALHAVIEPFMTDASAMMELGTGDARLARRMGQEDQITVAYDGPDMNVIIPHTQEAATYWGRNTDWCTAWGGPMSKWPGRTNQFAHYNEKGSLYIITLKPSGTQYQLCFGRKMYCDAADHPIDMPALVRAHPALVKACGENNFLPDAEKIGLEFFSPNIRKKLFAAAEGRRISGLYSDTREAIEALPPEVRNSLEFQMAFLEHNASGLRKLPPDSYAHNLIALATMDYTLWEHIPDELRSPALAEIVAAKFHSAAAIEVQIPKEYWTPAIHKMYWENKASTRINFDEGANPYLRLSEVPQAYRSDKVVIACLCNNPGDIADNHSLLTPELIKAIIERDPAAAAGLPSGWMDDNMVDIVRSLIKTYRNKYNTLCQYMSPEEWSTEDALWLAQNDTLNFDLFPKRLLTKKVVLAFLGKQPDKVDQVPPSIITAETLEELSFEVFQKIVQVANPGLITDEILLKRFRRVSNDKMIEDFFASMPKSYRTKPVMDALQERGLVPVQDMVDPTKDMVTARVFKSGKQAWADIQAVPDSLMDEDLASRIIQRSFQFMNALPDRVFTEKLLENALIAVDDAEEQSKRQQNARQRSSYSTYGYNAPAYERPGDMTAFLVEQFNRFPRSAWTGDLLAKAIKLKIMPPKLGDLEPHQISSDLLLAVMRDAPDEIRALAPTRQIKAKLARAGEKDFKIIGAMTPEQFSDEFVVKALRSWTKKSDYYDHNRHGSRAALASMPRDDWDQEAYEIGVVRIVPLDKVPSKFRTPTVIAKAVLRLPHEIENVPNPLAFLNAHLRDTKATGDEFGDSKAEERKWLKSLEKLGFVRGRKGWSSTKDELTKQPLEGCPGFSVAVVKSGPSNKRVYLFDKKGEPILNLYTDKGDVRLDDARSFAKYQPQLVAIAKQFLDGFNLKDLNAAGVYKTETGPGGVEDAAKEKSGALEWSRVDDGSGRIYSAYLDGAKVLTLHTESDKGGWGRTGSTWVQNIRDTKVESYPKVIAHSVDIAAFCEKAHLVSGWDMREIGVFSDTGGWRSHSVCQNKIGKVGSLVVWQGGERIAISGPKGVMATAIPLKNGKMKQAHVSYSHREYEDALTKAMEKICAHLATPEGKKKINLILGPAVKPKD